jgi:hypothetical protein
MSFHFFPHIATFCWKEIEWARIPTLLFENGAQKERAPDQLNLVSFAHFFGSHTGQVRIGTSKIEPELDYPAAIALHRFVPFFRRIPQGRMLVRVLSLLNSGQAQAWLKMQCKNESLENH